MVYPYLWTIFSSIGIFSRKIEFLGPFWVYGSFLFSCVYEGLIIHIFTFSEAKGVKFGEEVNSEASLENKRRSSAISLSRYVEDRIYEFMKS